MSSESITENAGKLSEMDEPKALQMFYGLSPAQGQLLWLLATCNFVSAEDITARTGTKYPKVLVQKLRARMKATTYDIQSRQNVGYWLAPLDREAVCDVVSEALSPGGGERSGKILLDPGAVPPPP